MNKIALQFMRRALVSSKLKDFNRRLDKIGNEKNPEAKQTLKVVRMVGVTTALLAIGSVFWVSAMTAPEPEPEVDFEDVRKLKE